MGIENLNHKSVIKLMAPLFVVLLFSVTLVPVLAQEAKDPNYSNENGVTVAIAPDHVETGDAGNVPATSQPIGGVGAVSSISGSTGGADSEDMYEICITNPAGFSATTVGMATFDTQLFLFDSNGFGVYSNDDFPGGPPFQSLLPAGDVNSPTAAGIYYLAISAWPNEPTNAAGRIFGNSISGTNGPTGPGGSSPITGWEGGSGGDYTIGLTGTEALNSCLGDIYGAAHSGSSGDSTLFTIDRTTGTPTAVGPIGFDRCSGIDFDSSGTLYGTCAEPFVGEGSGASVLVTIDTSTGAGSLVGPTGLDPAISDISFRNSDDVLYAYEAANNPVHDIATINTANGVGTLVGPSLISGDGGNGLAFSPADILYHNSRNTGINTVDQGTGATTFVTPLVSPPSGTQLKALEFDPITGDMYAINGGNGSPERLVIVDPVTGVVTDIGPTTTPDLGNMDALAIPPPPDKGMVVEVHCEDVFMGWVSLSEDDDLATGIGERFFIDPFVCLYTFENGEVIPFTIIDVQGDFTFNPAGGCETNLLGLNVFVNGQIILFDNMGNELVLEHSATLCENESVLEREETPGGSGFVNGLQSTGLFEGKTGTVETHRFIELGEFPCPIDSFIDEAQASELLFFGSSCGTIWVEISPLPATTGGGGHSPATIGILRGGQYIGGGCDIGIDGQCFKVTKPYHHELELLQMLTSPHTISNEIYCNEGYQECNHITIGFLEMDKYFPNTVMSVTAEKAVDGTWSVSWSDPQDFIRDPDDPPEDNGEIVFTSQLIDNKRVGTSFSLDFRNKDTGQLKIGFHVEDTENGFTNIYANEGIMLLDADAYPAVEALYDKPLEVEPLCLGEDASYRNSCAFDKVREWTLKNAEDTLQQMLDNEYNYK